MRFRQIAISILPLAFFVCNPKANDMDDHVQMDEFKIIGISVKTTNENGRAMTDMGQLWSRFYSENVISRIPGKTSDDIYSIYTDYQTDYTGSYTAIIGCEVNSLDNIPDGLTGREFKGSRYVKYVAKGKMPDAVVRTWQEIWDKNAELNRTYTADFEVYRRKSPGADSADVEIYIAVE